MTERIQQKIETAIPGACVYINNPAGDKRHFDAVVVSTLFEGLPTVKQYKMVMEALREEFSVRLHALRLKTYTPQTWESKSAFQYSISSRTKAGGSRQLPLA